MKKSTYGSASLLHLILVFLAPKRANINLSAAETLLPLFEKQQKAQMKNVFFFVLLWVTVLLTSRLSDLAVLCWLLWLWLRWPQTRTPLSVFLVYLVFLEMLKNVCVLCKEACRVVLFHWLSSQVFQMTVSHQPCGCVFTSVQLLQRKISKPLGLPEHTLPQLLY